jgi:polysaccharide deacetylase family sporulation protein PdaB
MKAAAVSSSLKKVPVYCVNTTQKKVALTVNAAWDDKELDDFLEIFKKQNIKTTFFVVGDFVKKHQNALVRITAGGHEIGSHSDTHPDMTKLTVDEITKELNNCKDKIQKTTGTAPTLFRAPSGAYNNTVISTAETLGYTCVQWDVDTIDWKGKTADQMVNIVKKKLKNGSIILTHLGAKNTKEALPKIIKTIKDGGYEIVPLSELIYPLDNSYTDSRGVQHKKQ